MRVDTAFDAGGRRLRRPRPGRALDHAGDRRAPTPSCTRWAGRTRSRRWRDGELVGGLYGVAIGGLFAGESMFHRATDASKVALVALVELVFADGDPRRLLDVQWAHRRTWRSLGVVEVPRADYLRRLDAALRLPLPEPWAVSGARSPPGSGADRRRFADHHGEALVGRPVVGDLVAHRT